jgi:hypothetical protein
VTHAWEVTTTVEAARTVATLVAETSAREVAVAWDNAKPVRPGGEGGTGEGIKSRGGEFHGVSPSS